MNNQIAPSQVLATVTAKSRRGDRPWSVNPQHWIDAAPVQPQKTVQPLIGEQLTLF